MVVVVTMAAGDVVTERRYAMLTKSVAHGIDPFKLQPTTRALTLCRGYRLEQVRLVLSETKKDIPLLVLTKDPYF